MCQTTDCEEILITYLSEAKESMYCAFFDYDLKDLNNAIQKSNVSKLIIVDGDNQIFNEDYILYDKRSAYMHHKFCVIDNNTTITGSFNPTINGLEKNDNNINIIQNNEIAKSYTKYIKALQEEIINNNKTVQKEMQKNYNIEIETNHSKKNITICFTRGGDCNKVISNELKKAKKSIYGLAFTITDETVGNTLLAKATENPNLEIRIIFEKSLITKYSQYNKFAFQNLSNLKVLKDCNPGKLHHKVFVIDNETIITGSMNPSSNADKNNDENVIIFKNKEIAEKYINEFNRLNILCMT